MDKHICKNILRSGKAQGGERTRALGRTITSCRGHGGPDTTRSRKRGGNGNEAVEMPRVVHSLAIGGDNGFQKVVVKEEW